ncbi:hypothetical protein D3C75_578620 [compost metagenome]
MSGVSVHQILPRANVQLRQHAPYPQAFGARQDGLAATEEQLPATVGETTGRGRERETRQVPVVDPITPLVALQGHAERGVAPGLGGYAERCRQIDGHALEAGIDHQLAVGAVQGQLQLIRDHTAHR